MTAVAALFRLTVLLLVASQCAPPLAQAGTARQVQMRPCGTDALCFLEQGTSLHARGLYYEAETAYLASLALVEGVRGREYMTATILTMLGQAQLHQGKVESARSSFLAALPTLEARKDPLLRPAALNGLARTYLASRDLDQAKTYSQQALAIAEADGSYTPNIADCLDTLADIAKAQTNYTEAETLYKRSLALLEQRHGPQHADVAITLGKLAALYVAQGQIPEAEPLYRRALDALEISFGSEHRSLIAVLEGYAQVLRKMNRTADASRLERRAQEIRDTTREASARAVPSRIDAKGDSGCRISMETHSADRFMVSIVGEGFEPKETVAVKSTSNGESLRFRVVAAANGSFTIVMFPHVKGKQHGETEVEATGEMCSVKLHFHWGR